MMSSATDCESPVPRKRLHSVSQRRQNKPLIEKRRRARINECLLQLKALLMKDMGKESPRPSKLEKADILEMTVDYIKKIADKKPENPSSNTSTEKSQPAPFLDGFSRCMEEVDTFLDNQLHLLPEVRHKLLSHCKGQITSRDLKLEDQSSRVAASLRSVSPDSDDVNVGDRSVCDSASDGSSSDEEAAGKVNVFRHSDDVRTVTSPSSTAAANTTTTTTFVAPFQHTSASPASSMSPQMCAQNTTPANNGIKLAGPLKLICGGNVFIVVDQQQQTLQQPQQQQQQQQQQHQQQQQNYQLFQQQQISSKSLELAQPVTSSPVLPVGSLPALGSHQVLYSPSMYSNGAFTTAYIPSLPQMNVNHCVGIPTSNVPLIATGSAVCSVEQKIQTVATALSFVNKPVGPNLTPPPQPSPEVFVNAGNDVNNNEMGHVMQGYSSMWRPW